MTLPTVASLSSAPAGVSHEDRLRRVESQYRAILETLPVGVWYLDGEGTIVFSNQAGRDVWAGAKYVGLDELHVYRAKWHETGAPLNPEQWAAAIAIKEGRPSLNQLLDIECFDGTEKTIVNSAVPLLSENGKVTGAVAFNLDVTAQARDQAAVRASESRFRAVFENAAVGLAIVDSEGRFVEVNETLCRITGYRRDELIRRNFVEITDSRDTERDLAQMRALECGDIKTYSMDKRYVRKDGATTWVNLTVSLFTEASTGVRRFLSVIVDISERKRAETANRESQERLTAALAASQTGTFVWNIKTNTLDWDEALDRLFGLANAASARSLPDFLARVHPGDRARVVDACRRCALGGEDFHEEFRVVWPDGTLRWLEDKGKTSFDSEGAPAYMTGACVDITEKVRVRQLLENRGEELEKLVKERTSTLRETVEELEKFSYSISHDLRAPLRTMQSFARILEEDCADKLPPEGHDYLRRIVVASERMDRLIQDVLCYSRLSRADVSLVNVDLASLVDGIIETYPHLHEARERIQIVGTFPPVRANEAALTQCISNLVGNALKFSRPHVPSRVRLWFDTRESGIVRFNVTDDGIGVAAHNHRRIFDVFEQVSPGVGGTGIGLAIVRKAIERMGGRVGLDSTLGTGSTFWLELPAAS